MKTEWTWGQIFTVVALSTFGIFVMVAIVHFALKFW